MVEIRSIRKILSWTSLLAARKESLIQKAGTAIILRSIKRIYSLILTQNIQSAILIIQKKITCLTRKILWKTQDLNLRTHPQTCRNQLILNTIQEALQQATRIKTWRILFKKLSIL